MEGMRHKLSLPGLGMSKCTDPCLGLRRCRLPCVLEAVCRLPRDTTPQTAELRGVREVQDGRDSACTCRYCTGREQMSNVLSFLVFSFDPWEALVPGSGLPGVPVACEADPDASRLTHDRPQADLRHTKTPHSRPSRPRRYPSRRHRCPRRRGGRAPRA